MNSCDVILVFPHSLWQVAFHSLLERHPCVRKVSAVFDLAKAMAIAKDSKPQPHIAFIDFTICLPDISKSVSEVVKQLPNTKVVVTFRSPQDNANGMGSPADSLPRECESCSVKPCPCVDKVLMAGGCAFLSGMCDPHRLTKILNSVIAKTADSGEELNEEPQPAQETDPLIGAAQRLSKRERQVLCLVAQGLSTKNIAKKLFVSVKTIETHRAQITSKTGIRSIARLTMFAVKTGLISLE